MRSVTCLGSCTSTCKVAIDTSGKWLAASATGSCYPAPGCSRPRGARARALRRQTSKQHQPQPRLRRAPPARTCSAHARAHWPRTAHRTPHRHTDQLRDQRGQMRRYWPLFAPWAHSEELGWAGCGPGGPTWPLGRWVWWPVTPTGTGAGSSAPPPYRRLPAGG
jgi:hypothetical protein